MKPSPVGQELTITDQSVVNSREIACVVIWVWLGEFNLNNKGLVQTDSEIVTKIPSVQGGWSPDTKPVNLWTYALKHVALIHPNLDVRTHTHTHQVPAAPPEMQRHREDQTDRASFLEPSSRQSRVVAQSMRPKNRTTAEGHF